MSKGLIALIDDVTMLARMAAATLDDAAAQAAKAGSKAAGIVIDDAAVTPKYVVGFASERELPIIRRIASGSLKTKLLLLLPGALLISGAAPWLLNPLLLLGGLFLCWEGLTKIFDLVRRRGTQAPAAPTGADAKALEDERVKSALRTDVILSAEIMAITLSTVTDASMAMQATVLAIVGVGVTFAVYGAVALIVKADDLGLHLARSGAGAAAALGRGIVRAMPRFLQALSLIGVLAMLWVGGGIVVHSVQALRAELFG